MKSGKGMSKPLRVKKKVFGSFYIAQGNVQDAWPKLFQAFSVKFTLIFFHECVESIIPHQHI